MNLCELVTRFLGLHRGRSENSAYNQTPEEWAEVYAQMFIARHKVKDPVDQNEVRRLFLEQVKTDEQS